MILINLLPHREAARKRRKELFQRTMLASLLVGALVAALLYSWINMQISAQQARNAFLRAEITQLNQQIKEIEGLEGDIGTLRARQKAVEDLQANRNLPVHLLNELVRQIPEGVYITSLKQNGLSVDMNGVAQSNESVSELLRNFSGASQWFTQPNLKEIVASSAAVTPREQRKVVNFSLSFSLAQPAAEQHAGTAPKAASAGGGK